MSLRGENRRGFIAACVYFACEKEHIPITSGQIQRIFGIEKKKFNEGYGQVSSWIEINRDECLILEAYEQIKYAERYCSILHMQPIFVDTLRRMIENMNSREIELINTMHNCIVGMLIFLINLGKLPISPATIEKITGISRATIAKAASFVAKYETRLLSPRRRAKFIEFYAIAENRRTVGLNKIMDYQATARTNGETAKHGENIK
jgi:transcription initiation factor TFIIIB Brf1 subunit/transcription initiation factor TFIIB